MIKSTRKSPADKSETSQPERHDFQFRAQVVQPRVIYHIAEGRINDTDLLIMWIIDSLVRHEGEQPGLGCFATNRYIAERINRNLTHVSERISHLRKMGIIVTVHMDDRRYLELDTSRTAEERESLSGEYGRLLREAYQEISEALDPLRKNQKPPSEKPEAPPSEKPAPPLRKNQKHNICGIKGKKNSEEKERDPRPDAADAACGEGISPDLNGDIPNGTTPGLPEAARLSRKFFDGLLARGKIFRRPSMTAWARTFDRLIEEVSRTLSLRRDQAVKKVEEVLDFHLSRLGVNKYAQKVHCADKFRERFAEILDDMERDTLSPPKPKTRRFVDSDEWDAYFAKNPISRRTGGPCIDPKEEELHQKYLRRLAGDDPDDGQDQED